MIVIYDQNSLHHEALLISWLSTLPINSLNSLKIRGFDMISPDPLSLQVH